MKNFFLKIRLLWLVYITGYFKKEHPIPFDPKVFHHDFEGYGEVDWDFWSPNEAWGNWKDGNNPYIKWVIDNVESGKKGLELTTQVMPINELGIDISSGQICSYKGYYEAYGRIKCCMKPPAKGIQYWWSFWMIGNECTWEIDMCEFMSEDSKSFSVTLHKFIDGVKSIEFTKTFYFGVDLSNDFHYYELDWQPSHISWYLDGIELCRYTGKYIPNVPMGIIINNAVMPGFHAKDVSLSKLNELFPASGYIKYVEV